MQAVQFLLCSCERPNSCNSDSNGEVTKYTCKCICLDTHVSGQNTSEPLQSNSNCFPQKIVRIFHIKFTMSLGCQKTKGSKI